MPLSHAQACSVRTALGGCFHQGSPATSTGTWLSLVVPKSNGVVALPANGGAHG